MQFIAFDFGTAQAQALRLRGGALAAMDTLPVMTEIAIDMLLTEERVFSGQGRRGGGSWEQLKEDTIRRKGYSKILYTSMANPGYGSGANRLYNSMTKVGAPDQHLKVFNSSISFGTSRPWAWTHQYGAGRQPMREFLSFLPTDYARWDRFILNHLGKSL